MYPTPVTSVTCGEHSTSSSNNDHKTWSHVSTTHAHTTYQRLHDKVCVCAYTSQCLTIVTVSILDEIPGHYHNMQVITYAQGMVGSRCRDYFLVIL